MTPTAPLCLNMLYVHPQDNTDYSFVNDPVAYGGSIPRQLLGQVNHTGL